MKTQSPRVIEVNTQQIEAMLERAAKTMSEDDRELLHRIVDSHSYLLELVGDKSTRIARLRKIIFRSRSEKAKDVIGDAQPDAPAADSLPSDEPSDEPANTNAAANGSADDAAPQPKLGHGRRRADDYAGAP